MDRQDIFRNAYDRMEQWLAQPEMFPKLQRELNALVKKLEKNSGDREAKEEVIDRFYKDLEFGTGGLRGIMGAGTNRMNVYTVRRVTQGLANYILNKYKELETTPAVAIAYDSRLYSDRFALEAGSVLAANGIKAYLYPELMPTPALSFAVRHHACQAGIMVTASHNPSNYNGYKVYNAEGCQVNDDEAGAILEEILKVDLFKDVRVSENDIAAFAEGKTAIEDESSLLSLIPASTVDAYIEAVKATRVGVACDALEVVYTPLNGTGNKPVRRLLKEIGVAVVRVVPEQEKPDGNFPTCPYPNPEKEEALRRGLMLCNELKSPDLLLATDPDADRLGVAVKQMNRLTGEVTYHRLSGNEIGVLLLDFVCARRPLPKRPLMIKTIVSTKMTEAVAQRYDVEVIEVLTGFKYIGEQIGFLEEKGEAERFVFGFEESHGYLAGSYVRDKDAVEAAMLVCEAAAFYKKMGKTLLDRLEEINIQHGYYESRLIESAFPGSTGMEKMKRLVDRLADRPPTEIADSPVCLIADYRAKLRKLKEADGWREQPIRLPVSNMVEFETEDGTHIIVRPSGTEPKLKMYLSAHCDEKAGADERLLAAEAVVKEWVKADE